MANIEWTEKDKEMVAWLIRIEKENIESLNNDRYGHQEIVSDLKEDCWKRLDWLTALQEKMN